MRRLAEEFAKLPGIGHKTAERLTYHVLKTPREGALALAQAIGEVKDNLRTCSVCCNISEGDTCEICADARRDHAVICVVEQPRDAIAIESAGGYRGVYHVLMGRIAPLDGIEPEDLTIDVLLKRLADGKVREVILATNPNVEGDATALYIARALEPFDIKATRIARGLPTGSSIEYASASIISDAIDGRRDI